MLRRCTVGDARESRAFRRLFSNLPNEIRLLTVHHFTLRELQVLAAGPEFVDLVASELRSRVADLFTEWALDVDALFKVMESFNMIMSGSGALYIIAPSTWWPADLDFYCPAGRYQDAIAFFMSQGYQQYYTAYDEDIPLTEDVNIDAAFYKVLGCVKSLAFLYHPQQASKINVIESVVDAPEAPIFLFHSTIVMNTVSSRGVRCFYPDWTLKGQSVVNYAAGRSNWLERQEKEEAVLNKYRGRGYDIYTDCRKLHGRYKTCHICAQLLRTSHLNVLGIPFSPEQCLRPGPVFQWMLGAKLPNHSKASDSAALVIVEGDTGDDVFDGIYGELAHLAKRKVKKIFAKYGY